MKIVIKDINDVLKFTRICQKFDDNIDVTDGHFIVDGKSQMGVVSICTSPDLDAKILTDDVIQWGAFRTAIREFLAEENGE